MNHGTKSPPCVPGLPLALKIQTAIAAAIAHPGQGVDAEAQARHAAELLMPAIRLITIELGEQFAGIIRL